MQKNKIRVWDLQHLNYFNKHSSKKYERYNIYNNIQIIMLSYTYLLHKYFTLIYFQYRKKECEGMRFKKVKMRKGINKSSDT